MSLVVKEFQTKVHPHGKKWWRYRYEYTLVESLVLAFALIVLYICQWVLSGISFFKKFKFYNTGLTKQLYRYAWAYFTFDAASLMVMTTIAYMLYMPWGEKNIFDVGGKALHKAIGGYCNVPYEGFSWLLMFLDVQFQLFCCFALYALFLVFVTHNFIRAVEDWKHYDENPNETKERAPMNDYLLQQFQEIVDRRVAKSTDLQRAFDVARLSYIKESGQKIRAQLRSEDSPEKFDFKAHIFLIDVLGKALEYFVETSFHTFVFLIGSSLIVAFLAHHFKLAFMYFLPFFLIVGFGLFAAGYLIGRQLRHDDHTFPPWVTKMHGYCRKVQIAFYCIFFSFSRLLLSNDIYMDYPRVYLAAFLGLLLMLLLCWVVLPGLIKATIILSSLPHDSDVERFMNVLKNVSLWYTTENCQECGIRQAPPGMSASRQFAMGTDEPTEMIASSRSSVSGTMSFR